MKLHIHGIEKRNQEDPFLRLDIDWVLDELGLEELMVTGAWRRFCWRGFPVYSLDNCYILTI